MLTNANNGTSLVQNWQKYANLINEQPLRECIRQLSPYFQQKVRPWRG